MGAVVALGHRMSIAYWCILVAAALPYATAGIAKTWASGYDNRRPRSIEAYQGLALRAYGAHANGFEAFPFFAIAVLVASRADPHASISTLDRLAAAWVLLRLAYIAAYLGDRPTLRSALWSLGLIVAVAIFTMPSWGG